MKNVYRNIIPARLTPKGEDEIFNLECKLGSKVENDSLYLLLTDIRDTGFVPPYTSVLKDLPGLVKSDLIYIDESVISRTPIALYKEEYNKPPKIIEGPVRFGEDLHQETHDPPLNLPLSGKEALLKEIYERRHPFHKY